MSDRVGRETFDRAAERYDRTRPGYPDRLFHDLASLGGLPPNARILEIGTGTGQATSSLLERGYHVTGVELGANLAALARRRLARFGSRVTIHVGPFESWQLPDEPFDAVVAFTAFHWVDATTRVERAAAALRAGGVLATVATNHVAGGTERFFQDVQRCYARWDPTTATGFRVPPADDIASESDEIDRSGLFGPVTFRRYERDRPYTTAQYLDVLRTYSGHQTLEPDALDGLLRCIEELIDDRYNGRIEKRYLNELRLARRISVPQEGLSSAIGEQTRPEVVAAGGATVGAGRARPGHSRVRPYRLLLAPPSLLAAIVLLSLAGAQTAVMLEGIARFGLERTAIGPMGGRALMYAVPGVVAGLVALFVLRRR